MHTKKLFLAFISLCTLLLISSFLYFPSVVNNAVIDAMELCVKSVIPSLFPFLVLTKLISNLKLASPLQNLFKGIMKPVFSLGEASFPPLLLGMISGYPIGASVCAALYKDKEISKTEASRLLAFCNNAGPAFILSTIGIGIFSSLKIGFLLLFIHIFSAVAAGFLFKIFSPIKTTEARINKCNPRPSFSFAFTDSVSSALSSSLTISAYITFFAVITSLLKSIALPSTLLEVFRAIFCGILEMTTGAYEISKISDFRTSFIIISIFLGFGGFCVHFQTLSLLRDTDIDTSQYFLGKLLQGIISGIISFFVSKTRIFNYVSTFTPFTVQKSIFPASSLLILLLFLIFFKKGWKSV